MQDVFLAAVNNSVTGIIAPLAAHDDIGISRQHVDDLTFAFIAPLRADQDGIGHDVAGKILSRCARSRHSGLAFENKSGSRRRKAILLRGEVGTTAKNDLLANPTIR